MAAPKKKAEDKGKDWDAMADAVNERQPIPEGRYESPYGKTQVDVGSGNVVEGGEMTPGGMRAGGQATGDDGNAGSSAS